MAGFNENADKKIKISSKPNAVTIEAIKEVQQMKSGAVTDKTSYDDVDKIRGMDIVFVTTAKTDEEARALLQFLGMPFMQA